MNSIELRERLTKAQEKVAAEYMQMASMESERMCYRKEKNMKVYKKWLVMGSVNNHSRVATSFDTKAEAVSILNKSFKRLEDNLWEDSLGQRFCIEKNAKEYK